MVLCLIGIYLLRPKREFSLIDDKNERNKAQDIINYGRIYFLRLRKMECQ